VQVPDDLLPRERFLRAALCPRRVGVSGFGLFNAADEATLTTPRSWPVFVTLRVPKKYARVSYRGGFFYGFLQEKHKREVLTQRDRVLFVYDAWCLSFQNKYKRNPVETSCIWIDFVNLKICQSNLVLWRCS
jgi:hypothetical protein